MALMGVAAYNRPNFRHVAAPTKAVLGVVRDRDTGKPLAGVTIESYILANSRVPANNIVHTTTDIQGRYRLIGLPKGKGNKLRLVPRDDQPYVSVDALVPDRTDLEPVMVDFELKPGVWIEGKLTDKNSGLPVARGCGISRSPPTRTFASIPDFEDIDYTVLGHSDKTGWFLPGRRASRARHDRRELHGPTSDGARTRR